MKLSLPWGMNHEERDRQIRIKKSESDANQEEKPQAD